MFKFCILLISLILPSFSIHDTRFLGNTTTLSLMIGEYKDLELPISLQKYQSIDFKANSTQYDICQIQDFDIDIEEKGFFSIGVFNTAIDVITSYDFLLQSIHIIDMTLFNKSLYFLYSDGLRRIDYNAKMGKFLPLPWLQRTFDKQIFITNTTGENLYLVDANIMMRVKDETYQVIRGFFRLRDLTSACFLNETTIAVLDMYEGVTLYKIDKDQAIFLFNFKKEHFGGAIEFVDLVAYNNTLLILDKKKGVFNLSIDQEQVSKSTGKVIKELNRDCSKLRLANDTLYIVCTELNQLDLSIATFPHKQYPHPSFRIKDILILDDKPMIVGNNIIKVYNGDFEIDSHLDAVINRIIAVGNGLVVANRRGVKTAEWKIKEPTVTCGIKRDTPDPPEEAHLLLDVVAKCNRSYFEAQHVNFDSVQQQLCLYHFPVQFTFWVGKEIDLTPLKIVGVVLGVVILIVGLIWAFFRRKVNKLRGYLMNYNFVNDNTTTDIGNTKNYDKFQDENPDEREKDGEERKSQADSQLHDIGS